MCFSVEIDRNIKKLAARFSATPNTQAFQELRSLVALEKGPNGQELIKEIFRLKRKSKKFLHIPDESNRVYPNYFAPVIVFEGNQRMIRPMRYRIRPQGSLEEIPTKYNVFNARLDSLEIRSTWKNLFGVRHGIFPFKSFFEWIEDKQGRKRLINFFPKGCSIMWAPCLFDTWASSDGKITFNSFAIITDGPPEEIIRMGHDRCPIFLSEDKISSWLNPQGKTKDELYSLLKKREAVIFESKF